MYYFNTCIVNCLSLFIADEDHSQSEGDDDDGDGEVPPEADNPAHENEFSDESELLILNTTIFLYHLYIWVFGLYNIFL